MDNTYSPTYQHTHSRSHLLKSLGHTLFLHAMVVVGVVRVCSFALLASLIFQAAQIGAKRCHLRLEGCERSVDRVELFVNLHRRRSA